MAVGRDVGEAVGFMVALAVVSLAMVAFPTLPSTVRPYCFWNARTAASVASPKSPSALPLRKPSSLSFFCTSRTASPLEPFFSAPWGVGEGVADVGGWVTGASVAWPMVVMG